MTPLTKEERALAVKVFGDDNLHVYTMIKRVHDNGSLVGIAGVTFRYKILPSLFLGLAASHRGQGRGKELLAAVLNEWKKPLFLTVYKDNVPALALYRKSGFRKIMGWGKQKILMVRL